MADMDRRLQDVEVGAGKTEGRLNQDFVEFLRQWGPSVLLAIAVTAGLYVGWQRYKDYRVNQLDTAWTELDGALGSQNPASLVDLAEAHADNAGVVIFARTRAGDLYLESAIRGVAPGAEVKPDGTTALPDDLLTPERHDQMLKLAAEQYQLVLKLTAGDPARSILAIGAHFGMAAVDESRGQWDAAKSSYELAKAAATGADLPDLVKVATARLESLDQIKTVAALPTEASIKTKPPAPPAPPDPPATVLDGMTLPALAPLQLQPMSPPTVVPTPAPAAPAAAPPDAAPPAAPPSPAPVDPKGGG